MGSTFRSANCFLNRVSRSFIARKRLGLDKSLYQILQIFSITSLEKVPILQVFEAFDSNLELLYNSNQLILFGL